ncbi:hypothetical protein E2562_004501 [Oryza meyeriana var. granulata]|uniref:Uncharacterized protein n=1 Tax=Oryza meyeriana var. granulata TaxID=110450 RepID=A0A6G1F3A4_9ORYZ|nr:hypothetical protein E2562_004501 [Oryza meyeriana var. granulata]
MRALGIVAWKQRPREIFPAPPAVDFEISLKPTCDDEANNERWISCETLGCFATCVSRCGWVNCCVIDAENLQAARPAGGDVDGDRKLGREVSS